MRLAVTLDPAGDLGESLALAAEADRLGYAVVWAAEAYGWDAPTVLSYVAARTRRIDVGAAVMQIPGRTPALTAMTAATLDALSEGRFRLGLGVSGPQVSEGWHGVAFCAPLARTREYVAVVRTALRRERLEFAGRHYPLPLPGGEGKALRLATRPIRAHVPIYLAAIGPGNLRLAGEIADGWLAVFFSPEHAAEPLAAVSEGRAWNGRTLADFDVVAAVPVAVAGELERAADAVRPYAALYLGGMGSRQRNFYTALACRMGFEKAAREIQDHYLAGRHRDAAAAVPPEFLDATSLLGPAGRIADRLQAFAEAGVTTVSVIASGTTRDERLAALRTTADAFERAGVSG